MWKTGVGRERFSLQGGMETSGKRGPSRGIHMHTCPPEARLEGRSEERMAEGV